MKWNKETIKIKDRLIYQLQRFWIAETYIKKGVGPKRSFLLTATSIYGYSSESVTIKYYALQVIRRKIRLRWTDIKEIRPRIKRKKIINNIEIMKIMQTKKSIERTKLFRKTMFFKWSLIILFVLVVAGLSILVAYFII